MEIQLKCIEIHSRLLARLPIGCGQASHPRLPINLLGGQGSGQGNMLPVYMVFPRIPNVYLLYFYPPAVF